MQHYGAPTRLLDWTDNALVALYFALHSPTGDGYEPDTNAAVWVLNSWWLNRRSHPGINGPMLSDWQEAQRYLPDLESAFAGLKVRVRRPVAIDPPHVDRRLAAQGSHFATSAASVVGTMTGQPKIGSRQIVETASSAAS
jgi:hypothetical protein